ncbi:thiaminase/4-amino-5-aminomethyl-2-methylpyrimidine deaminase [Amphibacillus marinus]|uniref:Aminopyrimidine aminohydrolase n=1 Tax=Amphibacillus marinus TaxID=872970 RepID=A0A1H8GSX6_9BACI|nr:thiaminase II [Amphibacillus marinus]SEN46378.1 thiaminase/4-amino-5-aminomethyl-2-methylpyrimidine deaminase [Amphibacillus marinus]
MKFSQLIRQEADPIWQASFNHPFVQGVADGTLPLDRFRYYVMQDSYYLSTFARVQSLAGAKAESFAVTNRMAIHAQGTYEAEMALHRTFAKLLKITKQEQQAFKPAPTAYAYSSHMYRAAQFGHLGDIIAAILPCYWLYYEIGELLKSATPGEPIYQEWINTYGSDWFKDLVEEQIDRIDEVAETVTEADRTRMKEHFLLSSQYEYLFWEMAYTLEKWPIEAYQNK